MVVGGGGVRADPNCGGITCTRSITLPLSDCRLVISLRAGRIWSKVGLASPELIQVVCLRRVLLLFTSAIECEIGVVHDQTAG